MKEKIMGVYEKLTAMLVWPQSLFLLGVRLMWGWGFIGTGSGKLMHLERTVGYFKDLGIPLPQVNALLASGTELAGGVLLVLGLGSRLISVPLICTMLVAYATAEHEALLSLFSSDNSKFFEAAPWPFLFACLIVLLFGPGKFSVDTLMGRCGARCCGQDKK